MLSESLLLGEDVLLDDGLEVDEFLAQDEDEMMFNLLDEACGDFDFSEQEGRPSLPDTIN